MTAYERRVWQEIRRSRGPNARTLAASLGEPLDAVQQALWDLWGQGRAHPTRMQRTIAWRAS